MFDETLDNEVEKKIIRVGFGPRLGALVLDAVLTLLFVPLFAWAFMAMGATDFLAQKGHDLLITQEDVLEQLEDILGKYFMFYLVVVGIGTTVAMLYNLIEGFAGASPGKMILGLKVAKEDGTAGDANLFIMRWLLKNLNTFLSIIYMLTGIAIISTLGSLFGLVYFIGCFLALSERKQALHDIILKTAIFYRRDIRS